MAIYEFDFVCAFVFLYSIIKGESWITMEWIVKTFLKNKIGPEVSNHRNNDGITIKDLVKDKSTQWKINAPHSYTFFGFE